MSVFNVFFVVLTLILIGEGVLLTWLWTRYRRQAQRLEQLQHSQSRQQCDIVGLCAAAVRMDEKMGELIRQMKDVHVRIQDIQHLPLEGESPYQVAIEKICQGAGVDELVLECGISREEAALLIRMHREES